MVEPSPDSREKDNSARETRLAEQAAELADRIQRGDPINFEELEASCDTALHDLLPTLRYLAAMREPNAIEAGRSRLGDYRIVRELGRGGMGVVYEAIQLTLGRRVALKVLLDTVGLDPRQVQRFQVEAQAAASLNHPHIVPVYATGTDQGLSFYAMQFIEGRDLACVLRESSDQKIAKPGRAETPGRSAWTPRGVDFRYVADLVRQAAMALDYAHTKGVLHRDIKPSNLLVDGAGHLWITDFGLARMRGETELTRTGDALGTPRYMSPEQARGRRVALDGRTDVYALGATLYEFLTLRPAFECEDKIELLRRIIEELPTPPRRIDPRIPVDLETIVLKAMAKEAKDRYATASEMADDLRRFLEERPIKARRPNFMDHAAKWVRRHRVAALAATLVLVLSAVGAGVGSSRYRQWADEHEAALRKEQTRADQVSQSADRRRLLHDLHTTGGPLAQAHRLILLQNSESLRAARSILSNEVQPFPDGYDPRGFTYGYLSWRANAIRQLPDPDVRVGVGTLLSPDGRFLATGHTAYERSILDARTGRLISTIRVPRETVHRRLQFSPDGGRIGMLVRDRKSSMEHAMIWETQTGRLLADLAPPRWTFGSLHLVSGNRFVTIESHWRPPGATQLWETTNSPHEVRLVLTLSESTRSGQATRDGLHYGPIGGSADGKIFDVERGVLKHQLTPGPDQNPNILHPPLISGVGFTPNGKTYVELRQREWLYYWNVETGTLRKRFKVSPLDPSSQITMSSDGLRLAVVEPKSATVRLWDHKLGWTHELAVETDAPSPHSITARFLPDDSALLLSTSVNSTCHHLTVWDVASGQKRLTCPDVRDVKKAMAWGSATPDGRGVLVSGVSKTTYWDLAASLGYDALPSHKDEGWSVAFSPDSRYLATGCDDTDDPHTIKIFDAATTKPVRAWSGGRGTVASLAYSPDGRLLASGHITDIDNVRLWDAATGRPIATLAGHKDGVRVLAFSPDGKTLASGGYDGIVRLWDPTTKTLSYEVAASEKKIQTLAFCANGRYLVSEFVKGKGLWSGIQLTNLNDPERPRVEKRIGVGCSAVVCTPDGQSIVVADHGGNVYIQEIDSEYATLFFHGGDQSVGKIALAPDGHTLAVVGGEIGRIQLWDLRTRQKFFDLKDHGTRVNSLAFSPDGKTLASTAHDGSIHLWRTEE